MHQRRLVFACLSLLTVLFLGIAAAVGSAAPAAQTTREEIFIFDTRADLELAADAAFGGGQRPETWSGNTDLTSPTMVADLWFDNEQLANTVFGSGARPEGWIGASVTLPNVIARNVRHDLEIIADQLFGLNQRPALWRGADPILRCDRTLQNVLTMLVNFYRIQSQTAESAINYCQAVRAELEDELINILFGTQDVAGNLPDPLDGLAAVRGDLERVADELLGLNTRPEGYIQNRDRNSPSLIGDLFLDMNLLANTLFGDGVRPEGWIGIVTSSPAQSLLNLRHDVELLADTTLGVGVRPHGWQGTQDVQRCDPLVQSLVFLTQANYDASFADILPGPDYCAQLAEAANALVENPPVLDVVEAEQQLTGESNYAFAYLDVAATQYMGIMPAGTRFRPVYRNFGQSNMMFVSGEDFALYVDRRFTTVEETQFNSLPTLENVRPITFCDASWCNGPGPTPTPTGSGPLIEVLLFSTPQATPDTSALVTTKQLVSWNYVRVTYVQDNLAARSAQVALEICAQPAQVATACEPVISVFDNSTGTSRPVISQFNGLNVFELRYGYTANLIIEGATRYATDVWISDPTIR